MPCLRAAAPITLPKLPWDCAWQRPQRRCRRSASFTNSITSPAMSSLKDYSANAFRESLRSRKCLKLLENRPDRRVRTNPAGRLSHKYGILAL